MAGARAHHGRESDPLGRDSDESLGLKRLGEQRSVTLTGTSLNATTGTGTFNRTVDEATPTSVTVTATSATAFTTFSMTLTDTNFTGQDMRLGIGDLTVCS